MPRPLRSGLVIATLAALAPFVQQAAVLAGPRDCCCRVCCRPCGYCACCPAPAQTALQPVWQQRDITATEYRAEPVTETVPTTIYENALVDEGSYQTVWVPRLTTKAVAKTVYQTRTTYRSVPYQVTRRVSELTTAAVPYPSVGYVPATSGVIAAGVSPAPIVSSVPYSFSPPATIAAAPVPSSPAFTSPAIAGSGGPVPDPKFSSTVATPIAPRTTAARSSINGLSPSVERVADNGPALFAPAPSAAQVWRTPRGSAVR